jgi:hypothetical protein
MAARRTINSAIPRLVEITKVTIKRFAREEQVKDNPMGGSFAVKEVRVFREMSLGPSAVIYALAARSMSAFCIRGVVLAREVGS